MSYVSSKRQAFLHNACRSFNYFVLVKLLCDFSLRTSDELKLVLPGLDVLGFGFLVFLLLLLNRLYVCLNLHHILFDSLNTFHLFFVDFSLQIITPAHLPRPVLAALSEYESFPDV